MRAAAVVVAVLLAGCGAEDASRTAPPLKDPRTDVPLGTAVRWDVLSEDKGLQEVVATAFDSVTPENEMKPEVVQPKRGEWHFDDADAIVDFATGHGLEVRGHTLVWHQQVPGWLSEEKLSARELRAVMAEHISTVMRRYRGRVKTWDVVNEPLTDEGAFRTAPGAPWLPTLGPGYVELALRDARAADPDARLFVNEIGAESGGPKLRALVKLARTLKAKGLLDGVGLESHLSAKTPPTRARLQRTIEQLAATGVDVELTELDVEGGAPPAVYGDAAAACAAVPACKRVTTWGVSDRDSWLGEDAKALPFDADLRPKPAWAALTGGLRR